MTQTTTKKTADESNYEAICAELGINAEIHFLTIEKGRISFSLGRPEEILMLAQKAKAHGYQLSRKIRETANNLVSRGLY